MQISGFSHVGIGLVLFAIDYIHSGKLTINMKKSKTVVFESMKSVHFLRKQRKQELKQSIDSMMIVVEIGDHLGCVNFRVTYPPEL